MRLAKIQLARSIWLFDTGEMNPQGANILYALVLKTAERYSFRQFPKPETIQVESPLRFDHGQFVNEGQGYEVGLGIFSDGITGDSRHSTAISDLFVFDFIKWACEEFHLSYNPTMSKKRVYRSEIVVYADRGLAGLCEKFDRMSEAIREINGSPAELTALNFGQEGKAPLFILERKNSEPFENLKFDSAALMETAAHIKLLDLFGSIIFDEPSSIDVPKPQTVPPDG